MGILRRAKRHSRLRVERKKIRGIRFGSGDEEQPRRGVKTTGRGEAPAIRGMATQPRGGGRGSVAPSGLLFPTCYTGVFTPACNLFSPSGFEKTRRRRQEDDEKTTL